MHRENIIPQHQVYRFQSSSIVIRSDFDSGNLGRAEQIAPNFFHLWTAPDCKGTVFENSCRSWFYFHVTVPSPMILTFVIKNLNLHAKLFREGMRPVVKTPLSDWQRVPGMVNYNTNGSLFEVSIMYHFRELEAWFAFTYPWSYSESLLFLDSLQANLDESIYFHREVLIKSLEKRRCDILTISSKKNLTYTFEEELTGLFPERESPPLKFTEKEVVFISARVHPGETPGSHAMNGFLKFIVSADPRAVCLRDEFVFKLVPMINPDGVFRGHFRTDTQGLNLNRFYITPSLEEHPTIFAIREVFNYYHREFSIYCYIDLHAHASKRAIFMYGNYMDFHRQLETCMFVKLLAANCVNFDFEGSIFTEKNMKAKDRKDGLSKEGSGRVALFRMTNVTRCYTLECNYNGGGTLNALEDSGLPEHKEARNDSSTYEEEFTHYDVPIFEDVGKAIGLALLDSCLKNTYSRVLKTDPRLAQLRLEVAMFLSKNAPYRFDSQLKKAVKSLENFEEYLKNLAKSFAPLKKENPVPRPLKKKLPQCPSRLVKRHWEDQSSTKIIQPSHSALDSAKLSRLKVRQFTPIPMQNFDFKAANTRLLSLKKPAKLIRLKSFTKTSNIG